MRKKLIIYSTSGCHLCEQAIAIVYPLLESLELELEECDIANSDQLMAAYGLRIPVLQLENATRDLSWPFNQEDCKAYLAEASSGS